MSNSAEQLSATEMREEAWEMMTEAETNKEKTAMNRKAREMIELTEESGFQPTREHFTEQLEEARQNA